MTAWQCRMSHRSYVIAFAVTILVAIGLRTCSAQVAALGCRGGNVRYAGSTLPLLMGGVMESCKEGCQPREDKWSKACEITNRNPTSPTIRKCAESQTQSVVNQLLQDGHRAMLVFTPCELHAYIRGRTLWLIGDSLMQNYYFALRCFMIDFWEHSLGECQVSQNSHIERTIYHAADTNISSPLGSRVITDLPRCLWLTSGGRICWVHSVRGEEIADPDPQAPGLLQTLQRTVAEPDDIFYVNFGRWHFNNCKGLQSAPYKQSLWNLGKLYEQTRGEFPNLIFKVSAHDHTACREGTRYDPVDTCLPAGQGGYPMATGRRVMQSAENILGKFNVPIVNTYNETVKLHDGHIADRPIGGREVDCIHYCSPGVPEFEMWSMYKAFRMYSIRLLPAAPSSGSRRSSSSGSRRPRVRAADPAAATAAAAAEEAELAELTVELGPAASRSSSSSTSTEAEVSAAGVGDSLEDLIGFIVRRNPNGGRQQPNPSPPRAPLAPKDLHPRCVPVTAKKPPPGWSYYYDSLMRRGDKPLLHLEGVAAVSADSEENVLGTCTGDEF